MKVENCKFDLEAREKERENLFLQQKPISIEEGHFANVAKQAAALKSG